MGYNLAKLDDIQHKWKLRFPADLLELMRKQRPILGPPRDVRNTLRPDGRDKGCRGLIALAVWLLVLTPAGCAKHAEHLAPSQVLFDASGRPAVLITSDIGRGTIRTASGNQTMDAALIRFWPFTHPTALKIDGSFDVITVGPEYASLQVIESNPLAIRKQIDIDTRYLANIAPEFAYPPSVQQFGSYVHANCDALSSASVDWVVDVANNRILYVGKPPLVGEPLPNPPLSAACIVTPSGELRYVRVVTDNPLELALCSFERARLLGGERRLCDQPLARVPVENIAPLPRRFALLTADGDYILAGPQGVVAIAIPESCWEGSESCGATRVTAESLTTFASLHIMQISVAPDGREFLLFEYGGCAGRSSAIHWGSVHSRGVNSLAPWARGYF